MDSFWDYNVWGTFSLFAILLGCLLLGSILRKVTPFLRNSLIPISVIGGGILILVSAIYRAFTGEVMFDTAFFGGNGTEKLEIITYHALALGFIASTLKETGGKLTKNRLDEIVNTGVTTVSTYLVQGVLGFGITIIAAGVITGFFPAAGVLLPFGYGQGTGQALNYGTIYETEFGFIGGKSFGLSLAALGFLSASIGGVIHLNVLRLRKRLKVADKSLFQKTAPESDTPTGKPISESLDRMTVQIALIAIVYFATYGIMYLLGLLLPGMRSVIFGFNFLIGVLAAMLTKMILRFLRKKSILRREYRDNFLLTRSSNFCFDVMIISGIAAIRLDTLEKYWGLLLILGVSGAIATYVYLRVVISKLFPTYREEQFLMMYGMLTGTASTGTILLREIDSEFETPATENMIYQNLPAIVLGFPMMLLATLAPKRPYLTLIIFVLFLAALQILLFRKQIFRRRKK